MRLNILGCAAVFYSRCECPIEHQLRDALWMLQGVGDRDGTSARDFKQRESLDAGRVNDSFKIADPGVKTSIAKCTAQSTRGYSAWRSSL